MESAKEELNLSLWVLHFRPTSRYSLSRRHTPNCSTPNTNNSYLRRHRERWNEWEPNWVPRHQREEFVLRDWRIYFRGTLFKLPRSRLGPPKYSCVELIAFAQQNRIVSKLWLATIRESRNVTKQPKQRVRQWWVAPEQSGDSDLPY